MSAVIGFARGLSGHPEEQELPPFDFAWLEAPLAARLARLQEVPDWRDLRTWPDGRVFGQRGEYRWQSEGDGTIHAVLLLESGPLPPGFAGGSVDLGRLSTTDADMVLWGEWVDPGRDPEGNPDGGPRYYAREIPEVQTYPVDVAATPESGLTPRLTVRRYRDLAGAHGEFLRCVAVRLKAEGRREARDA